MNTRAEKFNPDYLVTPGEILEETLEARGIKKREFADRCGRTAKLISEIIAGKAAITPETALQFERVLGVAASLWSNLETDYRLHLAIKEENESLKQHSHIAKKFPIKSLEKLGFIRNDKKENLISELLRFFGVGNVEALDNCLDWQASYFKKSKSFSSDLYAVAAWLRCGQIEAEKITTEKFDIDRFKENLKKIRLLSVEQDVDVMLEKLTKLCAEAGVAVVFTPELKGTRLCGAARWLNQHKALIQLSLRHKSDDHLWFTFFHEAAHIILHGKKDFFVDEVDQEQDQQELEADNFAETILIPKDDWKIFVDSYASFSAQAIKAFASQQKIASGIVLGKLQHQGLVPFSAFNSLKTRYQWESDT